MSKVRQSGRFVVLVGPDGVGKTTVARLLIQRFPGTTGYVYFRPPLKGPLPSRPPHGPSPRGVKDKPQQPVIVGWLRLLKNLIWFWVGYLRVIRPAIRSGALVVGDRWGYGYAGQPGPLRFYGPPVISRLAVRLMPRPHLVANLSAPPSIIIHRKDELSLQQAANELLVWASLPVRQLWTYDATLTPDEVASSIEESLRM